MKKFIESLNKEHEGFAITFEVIATLAMFTVFTVFTLYMLRVMNVQRYMNTVMTATAAEASRWGGTNTRAYSVNVSSTPLMVTAQNELNYVASDFNPKIKGTPQKITHDGDLITITVEYSLPPVFGSMSKVNSSPGTYDMYGTVRNMKMKVSVHSIMSPGKLL